MSIPVALEDLVAATRDYRWAYLVTVRDDATPHVLAVTPEWSDRGATMATGNSSRHNVGARPTVTLCYPPLDPDGYSLIVDGTAVAGDEAITFTPTGAVLHRTATPGGSPSETGCVNDCAPVPSRSSTRTSP